MSKAEAERVSEPSVTSDSIQPVSAADADIDLDELQLQAQGHKGELPRHFSMMSLLAFAFSIMNSWTGVAPLVVTSLYLGGPTAATWTPILACIATFIIDLGLAELASAFPSSGGQYQYVDILIHDNQSRFLLLIPKKFCLFGSDNEISISNSLCDSLVQHLCLPHSRHFGQHHSCTGGGRADPNLSSYILDATMDNLGDLCGNTTLLHYPCHPGTLADPQDSVSLFLGFYTGRLDDGDYNSIMQLR